SRDRRPRRTDPERRYSTPILFRIACGPLARYTELTSSPSGIGMIRAFGSVSATDRPNLHPASSPSVRMYTVSYPANARAKYGLHIVAPGTPIAETPHNSAAIASSSPSVMATYPSSLVRAAVL